MKTILEIIEYKNVLLQLIKQFLKLKYRRSVLGYFWTLLNPLLMLFVLAVVFSALLKLEFFDFLLLLFAGLVPWNMFSGTITQSLSTYINNEDLIKKIYIPKILFPLSVSIALVIDSIIFFILIFPLTLVIGGDLNFSILTVLPAFFILFIFSLSICLICSLLTVYFRDFQWLIPVLLQALFFLTPILYDKTMIIGYLSWFNKVNPLTPFIDLFKNPIYYGVSADIQSWCICIFISLISLVLSMYIMSKKKNEIVYRL